MLSAQCSGDILTIELKKMPNKLGNYSAKTFYPICSLKSFPLRGALLYWHGREGEDEDKHGSPADDPAFEIKRDLIV
jgi:hypothetical protein